MSESNSGPLSRDAIHREYRRVWKHLFAELLSWSDADVKRWEEDRFGVAQVGGVDMGVIQHRGIAHYVAEVLLTRSRDGSVDTFSYLHQMVEVRGLIDKAVEAFYDSGMAFCPELVSDLKSVLSKSGCSLTDSYGSYSTNA